MKATGVRCILSSPSAPPDSRARAREPGAVTEDIFATFCVLALPVEPEVQHLFERAQDARTIAELQEIWREIDRIRANGT